MDYDKTDFNKKLITLDASVWTFRNNKSAVKNPEMCGWIKLDKTKQIWEYNVKFLSVINQ